MYNPTTMTAATQTSRRQAEGAHSLTASGHGNLGLPFQFGPVGSYHLATVLASQISFQQCLSNYSYYLIENGIRNDYEHNNVYVSKINQKGGVMKLNPIESNMTELEIGNKNVLFSYRTPVAYCENGVRFFKTSKKWGVTTSRHINKWLNGANAKEVEQEQLDALVR